MSLQLVISEKTDFRNDNKGRPVYTVTKLFDFGRTGFVLGNYIKKIDEQENNSTVYVDSLDFKNAYNEMQEDVQGGLNSGDNNFKLAFETLQKFIKNNNLLNTGHREFEVYMSY